MQIFKSRFDKTIRNLRKNPSSVTIIWSAGISLMALIFFLMMLHPLCYIIVLFLSGAVPIITSIYTLSMIQDYQDNVITDPQEVAKNFNPTRLYEKVFRAFLTIQYFGLLSITGWSSLIMLLICIPLLVTLYDFAHQLKLPIQPLIQKYNIPQVPHLDPTRLWKEIPEVDRELKYRLFFNFAVLLTGFVTLIAGIIFFEAS